MYSSVALCLTNLFFVTKYTWDKEMHVQITESGHVWSVWMYCVNNQPLLHGYAN